jgi:hypothetical protein
MPTPEHQDNTPESNKPEPEKREQPDTSAGYERSDVQGAGIVVFLTALAIFVAVSAALSYGIGKVLFTHMAKEDGPRGKWATTVDVRTLGNLASSPELQNKMVAMSQNFPTPRLQTDDGNQEIADLHAREDLLLDNYSWADRSQGKVRIPIERAMELIAQSGLPVAPAVEQAPLLTGDSRPLAAVPLTSGFARTGYELGVAQAQAVEAKRSEAQAAQQK